MPSLNLAYSRPVAGCEADAVCGDCQVRDISVCQPLTPDELQRLRAMISTVHVETGRPILREGEPAEVLYNVVAGALKLYKLLPDGRRQITGFLFPGDFLGIALNDIYVYTAEALTPLRLCRFPRRRLEALLLELPALEHRLLGEVASELVAAQEQMLLLGRKTARERTASFLLMLARRAERRGQPGSRLSLPMSRVDIADYLGLTTETVSRTITQLRRMGVIGAPGRNDIEILDRTALERASEGG